jgi:hypothetical protein
MKSYNEILNHHSSDKGSEPLRKEVNGNGYGELYGFFFDKYRQDAQHICDIGIHEGASLLANKEYFENATIHGIDIINKNEFVSDRAKVYQLDQSDPTQLINFRESMKNQGIMFDIIIDDGSHDVSHQQLTLGILFDLVRPGGLYVIEDLCTSYFVEGTQLMGYVQTTDKREWSTVNFLNNRPFRSPWIDQAAAAKIDDEAEYIVTLDKSNKFKDIPYAAAFRTVHNYPIRSITSIIKKRG